MAFISVAICSRNWRRYFAAHDINRRPPRHLVKATRREWYPGQFLRIPCEISEDRLRDLPPPIAANAPAAAPPIHQIDMAAKQLPRTRSQHHLAHTALAFQVGFRHLHQYIATAVPNPT